MHFFELITDCNGFVLFDPTRLREVLGRDPEQSENLYSLFMKSELGDQVLRSGAIVPIYPLTDGSYRICVRSSEGDVPSDKLQGPALATTGVYPLHVISRLVLADLAVLQEWWPELAWHDVRVEPGFYSVVISAYDGAPPGFDVVLTPAQQLPPLTATFDTHLDVVTMEKA